MNRTGSKIQGGTYSISELLSFKVNLAVNLPAANKKQWHKFVAMYPGLFTIEEVQAGYLDMQNATNEDTKPSRVTKRPSANDIEAATKTRATTKKSVKKQILKKKPSSSSR